MLKRSIYSILAGLFLQLLPVNSQEVIIKPVSANASREATVLLQLLYKISGKYTLTGQHSYPNTKGKNYYFAAQYLGKTPIIFSTDMGFAKDGDTDSYLARPDIVEQAIELHKQGIIVTLCWHAVPPTADEPVTFRPLPGANPDSLASVQGQLQDQQFKDVLTPGSDLYMRWCAQVDSVAVYLKKLRDAHVPVLWRPYHEMNGNWFWWGGRLGEYSTIKLYKQLFERLVIYHKINNLIWVWNVDRPNNPDMYFSKFYPGNEYLDIVSLDVYGSDFKKSYYDSLTNLSHGKPLAFGEVGNPPPIGILEEQPAWCYYATWAGMVRNTSGKSYDSLMRNSRILNLEDEDYRAITADYLAACGLPLPELKPKLPVNFTGQWLFNEGKSMLDNNGASNLPFKLNISHDDKNMMLRRTVILEYADDRIDEIQWTLDGNEIKSEFWNAPMVTTVNYSENKDTLLVDSKVIFDWDGRIFEMTTKEFWSLNITGNELHIKQSSITFWGDRELELVYDKIICE